MPSWTDIQQYARSQYKLQNDEENRFSLVFQFENGRTQKIFVSRFEAFEEDWIEFRSIVCRGNEMTPEAALRRNAKFYIGALALDSDGDYILIHNAPLATMDLMREFVLPLSVVAKKADDLERQHTAESDRW